MDKQTTRAFAAGLFTASLALLFYLQTTAMPKTTDKAMIKSLQEKNYVILSKQEFEQQTTKMDQLQKKIDTLSKPKKTKENRASKKENSKPYYTLKITPGMTSSDIGEALEKAGMIKSAEEFNTFLTNNDYAKKIQVGEYKIYSSMSMKQLAVLLTNR
ncbi:endolytic transglycosylase MltG [Bacillus sp. REN10]|uniref:endolytic transglycosylase MltG n=1 Tax=Bacillus sp. REN10 TaxID=2782541 RepID=UPI00193B5577|nr:endolytic transglycosylase MltG [Bacillus sp. REN10]